jgi:hypothetical protein
MATWNVYGSVADVAVICSKMCLIEADMMPNRFAADAYFSSMSEFC